MASRADIEAALEVSDRQGDKRSSDMLRVALFELDGAPRTSVEEYKARLAMGPRQEESGVLGNLAKGFGAGAVGTIESAALGLSTVLEEEDELKAREKIQRVADRFTPEGGDKDSITYNVGSGLGSILGTGAATLAGGAVAGPAGAIAAGSAAGVATQVGEASERAREAGVSERVRNKAITNPMVIGAGLLETIPYLKAVDKFSAPTANKLRDLLGGDKELKGLLDRARSAGTTGGVEALQELAQNTAQNLVEQGYNPDRELTEGAAASAGYGGATGAIYQLLIDVLPGRQRSATPKRDETGPESEADVQDVPEEISEEDIEREQGELFGEDGQGELFPQTTLDRRNAEARREDEVKLADEAETKEIEAMLAEDERAKKQIDIDEVIDKDKKDEAAAEKDKVAKQEAARADDAETKEIESLLAEDAGVEAEATAEEALKELPKTDRRVQEGREKRAAETRERILDETLGNVNITDYADPVKGLTAKFTRVAKAKGITAVKPTQAEISTIQKEVKELQKLQQTSGDPLATGDTARGATNAKQQPKNATAGRSGAGVLGNPTSVEQGREPVQNPTAAKAPTARGVEVPDGIPNTPVGGEGSSKSSLANAINKAKARFKGVPEAVELGTPVETTSPVDTNVVAPGVTTRGTTPQPVTVSKAKAKAKPKAKPKAKTKAKEVAPLSRTAARMEEIRRTGYVDEVPDSKNPVTDADRKAVKASENKKVATYFGNAPDPVDGILNAVSDIVLGTPATSVAANDSLDPDVRAQLKNRSAANATEALSEVKKIVSPEVVKFIDAKLAEKRKEIKEKPPTTKDKADDLTEERRRSRQRTLDKKEALEDVLDQAQFERAEKELLKQLNEDVDKDKQQKTVAAKQVVKYMQMTDRYKKFATLPPKPKKSKAQKEVDEVVSTLEEIEVYDEMNSFTEEEIGLDLNVDSFANLGKDTDALATDLTPEIVKLLESGDLKGAIEAVAKLPITPRVKTAAEALANYVGDAKVVVVNDNTNNAASKEFARAEKEFKQKYGKDKVLKGLYVASDNTLDNTIILGPKGVNVHTLLHEMTHAATVKALLNKGDPITKQLNNIYKQVKGTLPTVYGSTNLLEFVAEAFSNPSFQKDLSKIYKKDMTLSMFQKFVNSVNNLFRRIMGMSFKPVYKGDGNTFSALSKTDALILQILQPAMGVNEGITLAHMSTKEGVQETMSNMDKIQKAFKPMTKADGSRFGDSAIDFITGSPRKMGSYLLELAPMLAMVDIATSANAKLGKLSKQLHDAFLKQRAAIRESDNDLNVIKGEFAKWADKQSEATITRFNDVVFSSTTSQIDIAEKKASDYKDDDVIDFKGREMSSREAYNILKKEWNALSPDGQKVYNDMRQAYRNQFARLKEAIFGDIDKTSTDAKSAGQVKSLLTKRLFEKTELGVYFPLLREGNFKLVYELKADRKSERDQAQVEMFTTNAHMQRRIKELENDPEVVQEKVFTYETGKGSISTTGVVPPTAFVNTILTQLDLAGVDKEVSANILELYIDSLPESAFAKSIRKRKNREGYIPDALYTFNRKAYDMGRQIARLSNTSNLIALQSEMNEFAKLEEKAMQEDPKRKGKVNAFSDIVNQLNMRANYARNPKTEYQTQAQAANRFAFMYTIGFNASSAIVNMSQIPLFVMPYLSAEYGIGNTGRAIKDAGKLITASSSVLTKEGKKLGKSLKRKINRKDDITEDIEFEGKASLENYFIARYDKATNSHVYDLRDDIEFPNAEVKAMVESIQPLVQAAADANQLDQSVIGSEINVDQSGQQRSLSDSATRMGAWGFHNVENYNRQVTLATTYLLALRKLEADKGRSATIEEKQALADKALTKTQELNGGSVKETGARLAQTDLGSVALMYKNFGLTMYYNMFKSAYVAYSDPEQRKVAIKQLAGVHLTSLFFAGVQGIPLYGAVKLVANMFMDDEEEDWDSYVRRHIGEGWYKGAVTKYSGADVSKRVSLGQLLIQTNRYNPEASPEEEIFFYLGGPAWSTFAGFARGVTDLGRGNLERGVEGMVPAAFRNGWRGLVRYNREGALTRRGDVIYDDFSAGELAGQVLGFAPRDYAFNQEQNMMSKGIERSIADKRSDLLSKYYTAARKGDWPRVREISEEMSDFNNRHAPTYGKKIFISGKTIKNSMKRHQEQSLRMNNGVSLNPALRDGLEIQRAEWDKGWQLY
jgi:hypothetical protein